ncbi:methylmalonic aciduria and homocystinuria type C protein [Solea senegalensis]|uniref:Cyanocobalamin reductase / alkylcobalamin dealkylase n=1 Tax=Solea senegalensis TaxID=28829 RepID=A0AAV6S9K9_SOLSE|nr:cyanocobalamin reductase / alkylcobalamin dealkylase isoform X1 [Solea senegalensis]KAG7513538.1 methylmalonic aciduria and homocystinuria type C protein [Solea senegalensis]
MAATTLNVDSVIEPLEDSLSKLGLEVYPLKVGWYNSLLPASFHLSYPDDSLAVVVLSTPAMFELAFLPFIEEQRFQGLRDPIDQCVKHCVSGAVSQCFPGQKVDVRYDYELLPSRKPRFLAQTAAHVSGAAFYYQQSDVTDQPWADRKMFGVCVHPRFGGWFAIRALLVFEDVTLGPETVQPLPPDCVPTRDGRIQLLEAFNFRWQDWGYRDVVCPVQTYSQKQRDYFSTPPAQRFALLRTWGFLPREEHQPETNTDAQSEVSGHG